MDRLLASDMAQNLEIRLLGGLQITLDGATVGNFISSKAPALLAYLAVTRRPHQRMALAGLLWGEMSDDAAANNLRQALTNLRKTVGAYLLITRDTVAIDPDAHLEVDVETFVELMRLSKGQPHGQRIAFLQQSLALYRGDALEGFYVRDAPAFEEWALGQRLRLREMALQGWDALTNLLLSTGDFEGAAEASHQLLLMDPWREEAHRQRMLALARSGHRSAALAQYQSCRRVLETELDIKPAEETTRLYEQIRAASGLPAHNLPAILTTFVGREQELTQITMRLLDPGCRLTTLAGGGGMGKTRLALQAVRPHIAHFLDGVWYVSLTSARNFEDAIVAIAAALRFSFGGDASPPAQLSRHLADKNLLLLLDNFEHLIDAPILDWITATLQKAPQLKLLVTSIHRLNLRAESLLEVQGLAYPSADGTPLAQSDSAAYPAVQLFVERARRIQPGLVIDEESAAMIARLCQLVGGSPLALELAATWVQVFSVPEIVAEIERSLDFLSSSLHDLPERHRSLQAVVAYFWRLLTPEEQLAFRKQAVFRGGFTRAAFQEVTETTLPMLARLADKSLVHLGEDGRYHRHPLLIQFASAKLAEDPALAALIGERHARYFGGMVKELEPQLLGGKPQAALALMRADLDNIRQAWQWGVAQGDAAIFNDLADSIMQAFDLFGLYHDAKEMALLAIQSLNRQPQPFSPETRAALGRTTGLVAAFLFRLGNYGEALAWSERSLETLEPLRPHIAFGHSLIYAGAAAYGLGDFAQVQARWRQAIDAYHACDSKWGEATARTNLAEALAALGQDAEARQHAQSALTLAEEIGNLELMGTALSTLAIIAMHEGQLDEAQRHGEESLACHQQIGHDAHIANALATLAQVAVCKENYGEAKSLLAESVDILRRVGNRLYLENRLAELDSVMHLIAQGHE